MIVPRLIRWFDERLGAASFAKKSLRKVFPDHWSFMLGEVAMYSFLILVVTGVFLTFFYVPDVKSVVYHGPYKPLDGQTMSRAYESVMRISFEVRAGLVFRQIHHWAALVMTAAVVFHATRVFFTGAFRRPRELNWVLGVTLLVLTITIGFAGYSLPDDLLSGTGLRIAYSIALSVPFIGTWLAFLLFGGEYPAPDILNRLFVLHVMILPAAIAAVMAAHLAILWRQKHTNFPGRGLKETEIRGPRVWPRYAFASAGLFFVIFAVLALMGGTFQINPIWLYGPYNPITASGASQPDWYLGFTEGAIRLFPGWEIRTFGHEIAEPFFPGVVVTSIVFGAMFLWPWIDRLFTHDSAEHNLLQYPRDVPWRTAVGAATISFLAVLTLAGGSDVLASLLDISVERVTDILRVVVLVLPVVVLFVTYYICRELKSQDVHPIRESKISRVRRNAEGGFDTTEEEGGGFESVEERLGI